MSRPRSPRVCGAVVLVLAFVLAPMSMVGARVDTAAAVSAQGEQKIPYKPQAGPGTASLIGQTLLVLAGVIALAFAGVYAIKRYMPFVAGYADKGQRRIQVLETRRLTPRSTLFLVELDEKVFLIAQSGDRIVNLYQTRADAKSTDHVKD